MLGFGTSYSRQKKAQYAHFRVNNEDLGKVKGGQFTLYDFLSNGFAFSPDRKALAVQVLEALRADPRTFAELHKTLKTQKSSLYLTILSLERSGLIEKPTGRSEPYKVSSRFSSTVAAYADWWRNWLQ